MIKTEISFFTWNWPILELRYEPSNIELADPSIQLYIKENIYTIIQLEIFQHSSNSRLWQAAMSGNLIGPIHFPHKKTDISIWIACELSGSFDFYLKLWEVRACLQKNAYLFSILLSCISGSETHRADMLFKCGYVSSKSWKAR